MHTINYSPIKLVFLYLRNFKKEPCVIFQFFISIYDMIFAIITLHINHKYF